MKHDVALADQDARPPRIAHQRVEGGQLVIQPRPQKPDPQNQRRTQPGQAFFKVGAVLFGNVMPVANWNFRKVWPI